MNIKYKFLPFAFRKLGERVFIYLNAEIVWKPHLYGSERE